MKTHINKITLVTLCALSLSACGGGGGSSSGSDPAPTGPTDPTSPTNPTGPTPPPAPPEPPVTPNADLVYATQPSVTGRDYIGKTFPVSFVTEDTDNNRFRRTNGTVEYIDEDTVRVTYNGTSKDYELKGSTQRINYTDGSFTNEFGPVPNLILTGSISNDLDDVQKPYGDVAVRNVFIPNFEFENIDLGAFGFATPENRLTGTANYTTDFGTELRITTTSWIDENDDDTTFTRVDEIKSATNRGMDITADFGTGTVSGTLFDGSYSTVDDRQGGSNQVSHNLTITLENGRVIGSGFNGDLALTTTADSNPSVPGVGPRPTLPSQVAITNQAFDGNFFGYDANAIGGSYQVDFQETFSRAEDTFDDVDAEELTENRSVVGVFVAE